MQLLVTPSGTVRCLYDETIEIGQLGRLAIQRASHVEPDCQGRWWANLSPISGPRLGPFSSRSRALAAEAAWLEVNWLAPQAAGGWYCR